MGRVVWGSCYSGWNEVWMSRGIGMGRSVHVD
jgi:hypothetical protein